jgi:hypothetical protein
MRNPIDIDRSHSFAIVRAIGERLRASLKEAPEPPAGFRTQLARLGELECRASRSIPPSQNAAEVASNSAWSTYLLLHKEVDEDDDRRSTLQRRMASIIPTPCKRQGWHIYAGSITCMKSASGD